MLRSIKSHPFSVETHFDASLVLTFAVPKEILEPHLPGCLQVDDFQEKWGFLAVAMVKARKLRPKGFPSFLGTDFFLTGYRIFVRYRTSYGKTLRGLYILKSETNSTKMTFLGNLFTQYHYTTSDVQFLRTGSRLYVKSDSGLEVQVDTGMGEIELPPRSPFSLWKEARRFAGPLPFTFSYNASGREMLIIEGVRENWNPKPVKVLKCAVDLGKWLDNRKAVLASAFMIENIPYYWKKGIRDTCG